MKKSAIKQEFVDQLTIDSWNVNTHDQRDMERAITADDHGNIYCHIFLPRPVHQTPLKQKLGFDVHESMIAKYTQKIEQHLGLGSTRTEADKGVILTFNLPPEKAAFKEGFSIEEACKESPCIINSSDLSTESYDWLQEIKIFDSRFLFEQYEGAKSDVLRDAPYGSIEDALELDALMFNTMSKTPGTDQKFSEFLEEHPDFMESIAKKIEAAGFDTPEYKMAGFGATGVFFEADCGVVVAIRGDALTASLKVGADT